jgi:Fe-S-cluster containining protein
MEKLSPKDFKELKITDRLLEIAKKSSSKEAFQYILEQTIHYYKIGKDCQKKGKDEFLNYVYTMMIEMSKFYDQGKKDRLEKFPNEEQPQCKKGCSFCCSYFVSAGREEARIALTYAFENGIEVNKELLEKQKSKTNKDSWKELSFEERKCVFLKNNECQIYDVRPMSCRSYAVYTDPKLCDTSTGLRDVKYFVVPDVEIMISAVRSFVPGDGFPKVLVEELETKEYEKYIEIKEK